MDVLREEVRQAFEGPLADIDGLPTGLLYGIVLTLAHLAGQHALPQLRKALDPLLGEPTVRRGWFAKELHYDGAIPAHIRVGRRSLRVRIGRRLRGQRLPDLVHALGQVTGAHALRLTAHRRVFAEPGSTRGPPVE